MDWDDDREHVRCGHSKASFLEIGTRAELLDRDGDRSWCVSNGNPWLSFVEGVFEDHSLYPHHSMEVKSEHFDQSFEV